MDLSLLTILVFMATLGMIASGLYLSVGTAPARKKMLTRLASIQQVAAYEINGLEAEVFRKDVVSKMPALDRLLLRVPALVGLQLFIAQAGLELPVFGLLSISLFIGVFLFVLGVLLLNNAILLPLLIAAFGSAVPILVIFIKRYRRLAKFEEQFPEAMDLLARAVRAGYAFTAGLQLIADEMPTPLAGEFKTTYDQQNLGLPLRETLANLQVRVPLPDVCLFVSALQIQRDSGGNLAEILDKLSEVIRERFKLYRQVKVLTAEGRLTLYFLMGMPPIAGILFFLVNPDYMMPLFTDPVGPRLLGFAALSQFIGYLVIKKIVWLKV